MISSFIRLALPVVGIAILIGSVRYNYLLFKVQPGEKTQIENAVEAKGRERLFAQVTSGCYFLGNCLAVGLLTSFCLSWVPAWVSPDDDAARFGFLLAVGLIAGIVGGLQHITSVHNLIGRLKSQDE